MTEFVLECTGVSKKYGKKEVLKNINLQLERGKIIGLLGPNGSGKTTLIKIINGLLTADEGDIKVSGEQIGIESKKIISYLPDRTYLADWMKVKDIVGMFDDFYKDFSREKAEDMLKRLNINEDDRLKTLSKGNKEKVQLILVMSRQAQLYLLDEPIGGVDPAARDYILNTIITNYNPDASVVISTHLISDVEKVLDEAIFINNGEIVLHESVDDIREKYSTSVDGYFREVFKC
ncbi:ABC transporter ATP-binding protein [Anaerotignum sp. MSJ-24]|uniref:ABC transporter ATP-binding protein n=1 Tax=Anaerotignum sp. MSJ-24 TaxID=2841521 RepID=UPI001C1046CE|nr:ABC transporter ATP-binding protein [Anaerotignum sp. MSJ-24]MBU5464881.1 ABC transporter ATP-binding protein [Anaerotignum sp. MSJ-24]